MTKKVIGWGFMLIVAVLLVGMACSGVASADGVEPVYKDTVTVISANGDWTYNDVYAVHNAYLIENESNWRYVVDSVNNNYVSSPYKNAKLILANDIVFTSDIASLGNHSDRSFMGTIYGNGHKFVNFTQAGEDAHGLIWYAGDGCILNYVRMTDSWIDSNSEDVGGLIGYAYAGFLNGVKLYGCSVAWSNVTSDGADGVGGLVGSVSSKNIWINACWVDSVYLSGKCDVGGLVGWAYPTVNVYIKDSLVNNSEIYSRVNTVAGLVAEIDSGDCYLVNATVCGCKICSKTGCAGGLIGMSTSDPQSPAPYIDGCAVENCTITSGGITTGAAVGGLVGYCDAEDSKEGMLQLVNHVSWVNRTWVNGSECEGVGSIVGLGAPTDPEVQKYGQHYMVNGSGGIVGPGFNNLTGTDSNNVGSLIGTSLVAGSDFGRRNNINSVVVTNVGHGAASASPVMNPEDTTVQLTAYPDSGYQLTKWTSPELGEFTGNTFTMPDYSVTVTPVFATVASVDTHFSGEYEYVFEDLGPEATNVKAYYDDIRKTIFVEKVNPSTAAALGDTVLNITQFGLSNADVQLIEVDYDVSLASAPDAFSKFTNAGFNYLGTALPAGFTIGGITPYTIDATHSEVYIDALGKYTGEAVTVDTNYAVPGQNVRIAVRPLQNYSVYGWTVIMSGNSQDDSGATISKSLDPNDGATTYVLTMPASDVTVIPKLRDSGSTFVTYTFLDADTYVMEIPADFSLTGIDKTVEGKEVNITACDLLEGHNLKVTMTSANGYDGDGFFRLLSVKDRSAQATYAIGEKDIYLGSSAVEPVQEENKVVLDTSQIVGVSVPGSTVIDDLVAEGNLKTELQFTLKQMLKPDVIGKYKDKLTFTVEITTA